MDGQDNGLSLEGLAHRLEALERENERMRSENDVLRSKVATLEGCGTRRDEPPALRDSDTGQSGQPVAAFNRKVSRRAMLSKAGAAAVAAVAAATLLNPRQAKADVTVFDEIEANSVRSGTVHSGSESSTVEAFVGHTNGNGVATVSASQYGFAPALEGFNWNNRGPGVLGFGTIGVRGTSAVTGEAGVYASHEQDSEGPGVVGDGRGGDNAYAGVLGRNRNSTGVRGEGVIGVWGSSSIAGQAGVYAEHTNTSGPGLVADGRGAENAHAGVVGRNRDSTGVRGEGVIGVWGTSPTAGQAGVYAEHTTTDGPGVVGDARGQNHAGVWGRNSGGYGGRFEGGKAQLMLIPASSVGKPTSGAHEKGEIYMDSAGALFVCVGGGTPGTWAKFTTTLAPR